MVDQQHAATQTATEVELISIVFILALLGVAFRSFLAPLVTLAPAGLALALASPVIAESAKLGTQISSLMQLLLTALVLGAGTDYSLFLIFRYRENLRKGLEPRPALEAAVERVGESITFSAATVIAALLSLLLASFGLYRSVGPGLAIGIVIVLMIDLTFFPALLAILGRSVFFPLVLRPDQLVRGRWGRVAVRVIHHPIIALAIGTTALSGLALSLVSYAPSGFNPGGYITGSDSQLGEAALEAHFGAAVLAGTDVVFRMPNPVWDDPTVIAQGEDSLESTGLFTSLSDALSASGLHIRPDGLAYAYRHLGPPADLPPVAPPASRVPTDFYNSLPVHCPVHRARRAKLPLSGVVTGRVPGEHGGTPGDPGHSRRGLGRGVRDRSDRQRGGGSAAGAADVSTISGSDIVRIVPVVLVVLILLLALVLRSLIAPLYLVASVLLSYLASLGFAVLVFVVIGHQLGINFTLPFFMFVFIMALGEDYNILVMTRIREEAARAPLPTAVATAVGNTGTTVTSAGLVLAGTFGVLAITTSGQIRQIGTGLAFGILLDTFVVRTLLVPSAVVLVGRWNWWPSRRFQESEPVIGYGT